MTIGSLLLIVVAVGLLGYGLMHGSNLYLIGSVAASLLAAVALVAGGRQAARSAAEGEPAEEAEEVAGRARRRAARLPAEEAVASRQPADYDEAGYQPADHQAAGHAAPVAVEEPVEELVEELVGAGRRGQRAGGDPGEPPVGGPVEAGAGRAPVRLGMADPDDDYDDEDPPDEPPPQLLSPADAARVARMNDEVLVIDGRPRYHREGCVHLVDRQIEPLPVSEAVDLGFTPCGRCEPDSKLLAQARGV